MTNSPNNNTLFTENGAWEEERMPKGAKRMNTNEVTLIIIIRLFFASLILLFYWSVTFPLLSPNKYFGGLPRQV